MKRIASMLFAATTLLVAPAWAAAPAAAASWASPGVDPDVSFALAASTTSENPNTVSVSVVLSQSATAPVTIPFTVGGSATAADATVASSPLVIPTGQSGGTISVQILDDLLSEGVERVTLTLGAPTGGQLGAITAHDVVILDNEAAATIAFDQAGKVVSESHGSVSVTLTLSAPRTESSSVQFSQTGTASPGGVDVSILPASPLIIPAGTTSVSLDASIVQDAIDESDEDLVLTLMAAQNCALGGSAVFTLTITDDDDEPTVYFQVANSFALESAATQSIQVVLSTPSSFDVTVPVTTGGTASVGSDYTWSPAMVTIPAGSSSGSVMVTPVDDAVDESAETAVFTLGAPTRATLGAPAAHTLQLVDNDGAPSLVRFAGPASGFDEGAGVVPITVVLDDYAAQTVSVPVSAGGTATAGVDYVLQTTTLSIPVGSISGTVNVQIIDDAVADPGEVVALQLGTPTGAALGSVVQHNLTIIDNEGGVNADFAVATTGATESAGSALVQVVLSGNATSNVTIPLNVSGTATASDFTVTPNPLVIPAGSSGGQFLVTLVDDALHENDESVVLAFGAISGGATAGALTTHTVTIQDNDAEPAVGFSVFRMAVTEASGGFDVRLELSAVSGLDVTVPFTVTGEAAGPSDATLPPSPAVIPAGSAFVDLPVSLVVDRFPEPGERMHFQLGAPTGATVGATSTLLVMIEDGNAVPVLAAPPLTPSVSNLVFPTVRVGESTVSQSVFFTNNHTAPVRFDDVRKVGTSKNAYTLSYPVPLPILVQPGQSARVDVTFAPTTRGLRQLELRARQQGQAAPPVPIELRGIAIGATGAEIAMTASGDAYLAPSREFWSAEYGVTGGALSSTNAPVAGTGLDGLYQTFRLGSQIDYAIELPNGSYEVLVHSWEPFWNSVGQRTMDIVAEGAVLVDDLDIFAEVGSNAAYVSEPALVTVNDGMLDLSFVGVISNALVSGVQVRSVPILSTPTTNLLFGTVDQGTTGSLDVLFQNDGLHTGTIDELTFRIGTVGDSSEFAVAFGGSTYMGGGSTVQRLTSIELPPGQTLVPVTFTPTQHTDHQFTLEFDSSATGDSFVVDVAGTGGAEAGWGFLHPVLDTNPPFIVDYDGNGSETIQILGGESHTHEPGHALVGWDWQVNGAPVATGVNSSHTFPTGSSTLTLTITDDNNPADTASDDRIVAVYPVDGVPGPLALFYNGQVLGEVFLLDNVPARHQFASRLPDALTIDGSAGTIGVSNFSEKTMVQWLANFDLSSPRSLEFVAVGGVARRVFVDGSLASGPLALSPGLHEIDIRFAVSTLSDLPISLTIMEAGAQAGDVEDSLVHDEQALVPVIHSMPSIGSDLGGNRIDIDGFGFFPESQAVVHFGPVDFTAAQFDEWSGEHITVTTPPGTGTVQVTVETPQGVSEPFPFTYSPSGPVPIRFTLLSGKAATVAGATCGTFGPDGKLYVGALDGSIHVIDYDQDWNVASLSVKTGVSGLTNSDVLGVVFNPWDPYDPQDPSSLKLYVGHGEQFQNGGLAFTGPSYFTGQVSILTGPDFDNPQPVVTQLPTSNHDHSINGMVFDANGDLLISVGGNTNAGVKHPQIGDLHESPLSGAIVRARLSDPLFNGTVVYEDSNTGVPVDDQVFGDRIDVASGVDVDVYSPGHRNAFDLILHTNGLLYATDNGPNNSFGPASLSATTNEGEPHPYEQDEINLVEPYLYYGHPNRNRGRYDDRENIYRRPTTPTVPGLFVKPMTIVDSSTNGIDEYRSTTFNSGMRGELISMKWNFGVWRVLLSPDGRAVTQKILYQNPNNSSFAQNQGLDVLTGPGGAILAIDFLGNKVRVQVPDDVSAIGPKPFEISPWRTLPQGGQPFVIGGLNFGTNVGAVSVTIGGVPATVTGVSPKRIRGVFPPSPTGGATGMLSVVVTVNGTQVSIPAAMQFLAPTPGLATGTWRPGSVLPLALGEVAAASIGSRIYVIGEGDARTFAYDPLQNNWTFNSLTVRPFPGTHHGLEVYDGKLYVLGGLGGGSGGRVQIYDPVMNTWTLGAPMPWNGGSCSTALIDGLMYVCGGNLDGAGTAGNLAVYDPVAGTWTSLGVMPTPVNHAASATDGERLFVFGGRQGPNWPSAGFVDVQVYDPVSNTWETSAAGQVAPMPLGRGGTGRAVYFGGEFFVMGGEDATQTFDEVQVYNPVTNTWRMEAPMPTKRHGIYPALFMSRMFVFGGGLNAGFGFSATSEVFSPR